MSILIGADPEVFLKVGKTNISSHGLINGTKKNPLKVDRGAVQIDGTALEFNIDPVDNENDFVRNIKTVMTKMEEMVKLKVPDGAIDISPSVIYDELYFKNDIPEEAKELGCDPDWNAYTGTHNPAPDPSKNKWPTMRTGSGHVHIGWDKGLDPLDPGHIADCCLVTKVLDNTLRRHSTFWDKDNRRSSLYGAPGAFRPKPYGMEYRVLSNAWLKNEKTMRFVFKYVKEVMTGLDKVGTLSDHNREYVINGLTNKNYSTKGCESYLDAYVFTKLHRMGAEFHGTTYYA